MKSVHIILACTIDGGIGYKNGIPWKIFEEMQKFKNITTNIANKQMTNAVIMGKNTWLSLRRRPLKNRLNIVITSDRKYDDDECITVSSLEDGLQYCENQKIIDKIFIIGGASVYDLCMQIYDFDIYLTVLYYGDYKTDSYISIEKIWDKYYLEKDESYSEHHSNRLFASYICKSKTNYKRT